MEFLDGISRVLDIGATQTQIDIKSDEDALREDWETIIPRSSYAAKYRRRFGKNKKTYRKTREETY
jgi:hypothetical protein